MSVVFCRVPAFNVKDELWTLSSEATWMRDPESAQKEMEIGKHTIWATSNLMMKLKNRHQIGPAENGFAANNLTRNIKEIFHVPLM